MRKMKIKLKIKNNVSYFIFFSLFNLALQHNALFELN